MTTTCLYKIISLTPVEMFSRLENYKYEKKQQLENYNEQKDQTPENKWLFGMGLAGFVFIIFLFFILPFFLSIYFLLKFRDQLSTTVIVLGWMLTLLPIVPFGSIFSLILIFATKKKENNN